MWPDRVSNPRPLALESDALPTAIRGPAFLKGRICSLSRANPPFFKVLLLQISPGQINLPW